MKLNGMMAAVVLAAGMTGLVSCSGNKADKVAQEQLADTMKAEQAAADATATEAAERNGNAVIVLEEGETLPKSSDKLVVIDFNATWCGPCRMFAPNFEAVANQNAGKALFYSVDVDKHPELASAFGVQGIPMIAFVTPDGKVSWVVGYKEAEEFAEIVASHLK